LEQLRRYQPQDFELPAIVVHELFYGAYKRLRIAQNAARVEALQFQIVEFDREDAREAGGIRAKLAAAGTSIGPYDVLIAGQALARALIVITHNTSEFQLVPGLLMEDWE
jgi:tRNA(fMet)-specific endonuclease VapC